MPLRLIEVLPALAAELEELLATQGEHTLATQVRELNIVDRCRCGDDFCSTFYTEPRPQGSYGKGHRNVELEPADGMLILDVVKEKIVCVEVLYRDEIKRTLHAALP
jgi:hypothetical protein